MPAQNAELATVTKNYFCVTYHLKANLTICLKIDIFWQNS